jgi:hypothetical protein
MPDNPLTGALHALRALAVRVRGTAPADSASGFPAITAGDVRDPASSADAGTDRTGEPDRPSLGQVAPDLARVAAVSALQAFAWGIGATIAGANYVARRAREGEPATVIVQEAAIDLRAAAQRMLGIGPGDADERLGSAPGGGGTEGRTVPAEHPTTSELQRRGEELMRRSNDVHVVEDTHPAFARILGDITPDEARILRFLYLEGPQPALDVRSRRSFALGTDLVASGLTMLGEHAGLRDLERLDLYLSNLSRLGLLFSSPEQVDNPSRYQVIEAQPKAVAALQAAGRAPKFVQGSIRLTPFGTEFVRTCLPLNGRTPTVRSLRPLPGDPG